jgi:sensor histidine kinase YesM
MRAILTSSNVSKMPLNDALDRLQDYFDLQKMRFSDSVEFNYQNSITPNNYEIGSMLIVPFVENAFKYGIHPHKKSMISVNIDLQKNVLLIKIENTDHSLYSTETSKQNKLGTQSTKIGIENVRLRLNLYYPSSHKLNIYKHNGLFIVELSITFEDNK